jgi:hypothetical protein
MLSIRPDRCELLQPTAICAGSELGAATACRCKIEPAIVLLNVGSPTSKDNGWPDIGSHLPLATDDQFMTETLITLGTNDVRATEPP